MSGASSPLPFRSCFDSSLLSTGNPSCHRRNLMSPFPARRFEGTEVLRQLHGDEPNIGVGSIDLRGTIGGVIDHRSRHGLRQGRFRGSLRGGIPLRRGFLPGRRIGEALRVRGAGGQGECDAMAYSARGGGEHPGRKTRPHTEDRASRTGRIGGLSAGPEILDEYRMWCGGLQPPHNPRSDPGLRTPSEITWRRRSVWRPRPS